MNQLQLQPRAQEGVILLEALISILIFSLGVLALVGLQAVMIKNTSDSRFRADASYLAQQRVGQMWAADPATLSTFLETDTDISSSLPSGKRTVTQPSPGKFVVTITWQSPGEPVHNVVTVANIIGG
jgi:type IV pilus assembly protein PilV